MSKPDLYALQAFVTAARTRNLTRAAEQLHLTVSALSHQMRGLEERLGKRLFTRSPRGVSLTNDGQRLLSAVEGPMDSIDRAFAQLHGRSNTAFTLSAMQSFASSWLMPRLGRFLALNSGLELNLQTSAELVDFSRESVDAALRFGPGKWPGLLADHLFDEWITPVASPLLLQRLGKPKLANFAGYPLLADPGNRWRDWFKQFGGTPPKRYVASFDDPEMLLKAAVEGMGIAMGRHTMTQPLLDNGRLVSLTTRKMASKYAHYLVYPPRSAELPALIAFRQWLLAEVQAEAPPLRKKPIGG